MLSAEIYDEDGSLTDSILEKMKDRGIIIGKNGLGRNVLAFQPPLVISKANVNQVLTNLDEVFREIFNT